MESLPEMSPEAERGRSILFSPFVSPPILSQGLLFALPNQNAIGQEVWKPQFAKLSFPLCRAEGVDVHREALRAKWKQPAEIRGVLVPYSVKMSLT